ncbi:replication protein A 70 kDa DNA-binding subunit A-like [Cryptomeria japonica]|uniref:replication protein A 70 kDa DNA-binding subunit A-like n=1 Tax=Cryptomeria japonica TaxID=3369 RepID=UPI0027D9F3EB|nr:replication protein A 70 kDa DNA-binding subunit A-like [Cryptomeria japonica]
MHHFNKPQGQGCVFSFDIIDCENTEIRITSFNEVADLHYMNIQLGAIYTILGGTVKPTNRLYNKLNSQLEIFLQDASKVSLSDDDLTIPKHQFSFKPLNEIMQMTNNYLVDVIGIVICVDPSSTIRRRDDTKVLRRSIKLMDMSPCTINVTLWVPTTQKEGTQLQEMYHSHHVVALAIKSGRVTKDNGKVISTLASTHLFTDPSIEETKQLKSRLEQNGGDVISSSTETIDVPLQITRKTIVDIEEQTMHSKQPVQHIVKATIRFIKSNSIFYPSCPLEIDGKQCKKRAV